MSKWDTFLLKINWRKFFFCKRGELLCPSTYTLMFFNLKLPSSSNQNVVTNYNLFTFMGLPKILKLYQSTFATYLQIDLFPQLNVRAATHLIDESQFSLGCHCMWDICRLQSMEKIFGHIIEMIEYGCLHNAALQNAAGYSKEWIQKGFGSWQMNVMCGEIEIESGFECIYKNIYIYLYIYTHHNRFQEWDKHRRVFELWKALSTKIWERRYKYFFYIWHTISAQVGIFLNRSWWESNSCLSTIHFPTKVSTRLLKTFYKKKF